VPEPLEVAMVPLSVPVLAPPAPPFPLLVLLVPALLVAPVLLELLLPFELHAAASARARLPRTWARRRVRMTDPISPAPPRRNGAQHDAALGTRSTGDVIF